MCQLQEERSKYTLHIARCRFHDTTHSNPLPIARLLDHQNRPITVAAVGQRAQGNTMHDTGVHSDKDAERGDDSLQPIAPIVLPADRLRSKIPWILRDERYADDALDAGLERLYEQDDFDVAEIYALEDANKAQFSDRWYSQALSDAQVNAVAETFTFSVEDVQQLSRRLACALNPEDVPATITLSRERAQHSAKEKVAKALDHLMNASEEALKALELFSSLSTKEAQDRNAARRFDKALKDHDKLLQEIERLYLCHKYLSGRDGLALDLDIVDRRSVPDMRRQKVLGTLFGFWAEHGRKLSVTTAPIEKSRRKGPLVNFVNMAVRAVTDPPTELKSETIWQDLKEFKANRLKD